MVLEYRTNWSYGAGSPGVTVFHGREQVESGKQAAADDLASRVAEFFDDIAPLVPTEVEWTFSSEVLELDTSTGVLLQVLPVTPASSVAGENVSTHAAPAGARVAWTTPAIVAGRRLRGATFVVPISSGAFDSDGSLTSGSIDGLNLAAAAFYDTGIFTSVAPSVWSRTHGIQADITGHQIPDRVAVLRSRRD